MSIQVTKSSIPPFNEYIDEIRDIWDSHWLTNMGEKHRRLQAHLVQYLGVPCVELVSNGHMALELSIQALGLRGEIITTPFTFASTTHAIVRNGCTPVFCDINSDDYTIDVSKVEQLISEKTCAILPVHVYGNICNIENIERIANKYGLKVIYDAAHAFGEKYKDNGIANYGDISCFSFHATKVFNTIEGGAVCCSDREVGKKISRLRNFGIIDEETVEGIGTNAKMNEFCAAMGLCNLKHITDEILKRKKLYNQYCVRLAAVKGIKLCKKQDDVLSNYAYFPIIVDENEYGYNRNDLAEALSVKGINVRKYFYPITNTYDCIRNRFEVNETPVAMQISENVLTLPLYADLKMEDVDRICKIIISHYKPKR